MHIRKVVDFHKYEHEQAGLNAQSKSLVAWRR